VVIPVLYYAANYRKFSSSNKELSMTGEVMVRIIAGFFIMLSLAMAPFFRQRDMTRLSWLWFTPSWLQLFPVRIHLFLPAGHHA